MKALLFALVATASFSAQAWGLESFYGKVKQNGLEYSCSYYNNTGRALSMKYVAFDVEYMSGDDFPQPFQERIDRVVEAGDTIRASADIPQGNIRVTSCKFLAR